MIDVLYRVQSQSKHFCLYKCKLRFNDFVFLDFTKDMTFRSFLVLDPNTQSKYDVQEVPMFILKEKDALPISVTDGVFL